MMRALSRAALAASCILLALSPSAARGAVPELEGPSPGGIYHATLPNGLLVLMKEVHTAPLFCVSVWYRAGSAHESNGTTGLAHLLEHMAFKGTDRFGKGMIDKILESHGAINNASTWHDRTQYWSLISSDQADVPMELLADMMRNCRFTQADLDDEMPVVRNEMEKGEDNPYVELGERLQSIAYLESPYHWPTIGWKDDVEAITADQIHAYYDRYYWPNNAYLVLVGDLPASEMLAKATRWFGPIPSGGSPAVVVTQEPEQKGERRFLIREAGQNRILEIAYRTPGKGDPRTFALDLLGRILGDGKSARFYQALVETGLATDVTAGNQAIFRYPYLFDIAIDLAEDAAPESSEAAVYREIARIAKDGPSAEELMRARKQARVETCFQRDDIIDLMFAIGESESAANWQLQEGYLDSLGAVTAEDVRAAAAEFLVPNNRTVGFYLPDGQDGGSWAASAPKDAGRMPRFRKPRGEGKAALLQQHTLPVRAVLSNGAVLLVQESHENPTLELRGRAIGGSLLEPAGKEGLAALLAQTLTLGTERHDAAALANLLESNGVRLEFDSGADAVTVQGAALAEDLPLLIETLGEVLATANFPADQVELGRAQLVTALRQEQEDTEAMSMRRALEAVYGEGSPYARFREGSEASLSAITRDDLAAYRKRLAEGSRWSFAVVGDVDPERVKALFETALAGIPAGKGGNLDVPSLDAPAAGATIQVPLADKSQTDIVYLGPGVAPDDPERDAAYLANVLLGGSFASRLNTELRDNQGLTYSARSQFIDRRGSSAWCATLGVNPENVQKAIDGVKAELEKIASAGVTEEELAKAQEYAAGSFPIRLQSKGAVGDQLLYAERNGLGLDYVATFGERMRGVTREQLQRAVRRFTDPSRMVVVAAGTF